MRDDEPETVRWYCNVLRPDGASSWNHEYQEASHAEHLERSMEAWPGLEPRLFLQLLHDDWQSKHTWSCHGYSWCNNLQLFDNFLEKLKMWIPLLFRPLHTTLINTQFLHVHQSESFHLSAPAASSEVCWHSWQLLLQRMVQTSGSVLMKSLPGQPSDQ